MRSLVNRENLVRKIEFPRLAVPMATVLTAIFNLALNLVPVFVFLLFAGGPAALDLARSSRSSSPRWRCSSLGLAMLLSALFVRYRDIEPIWDVVLQITFYASPIFYTAAIVRDATSETVRS